ncbi:hypothetical protein BDN71DRAFT_937685 [Pleurotus eryngii]|uniref:Uncharacterized protein n=1 Tax=Pleurotus eryngii TaxID=5323 RepID=A0A9P5ZZV5_PLEER|nr:hypothetical protein BDN71DRAFT_937685 [Pleurotus eryngii]
MRVRMTTTTTTKKKKKKCVRNVPQGSPKVHRRPDVRKVLLNRSTRNTHAPLSKSMLLTTGVSAHHRSLSPRPRPRPRRLRTRPRSAPQITKWAPCPYGQTRRQYTRILSRLRMRLLSLICYDPAFPGGLRDLTFVATSTSTKLVSTRVRSPRLRLYPYASLYSVLYARSPSSRSNPTLNCTTTLPMLAQLALACLLMYHPLL